MHHQCGGWAALKAPGVMDNGSTKQCQARLPLRAFLTISDCALNPLPLHLSNMD